MEWLSLSDEGKYSVFGIYVVYVELLFGVCELG